MLLKGLFVIIKFLFLLTYSWDLHLSTYKPWHMYIYAKTKYQKVYQSIYYHELQ